MKLALTLLLALVSLSPFKSQIDQQPLLRWQSSITQNHSAVNTVESLSPTPVKTTDLQLSLGAKSVLALDLATTTPMYQYNTQQRLPIASITKLVTAMVIVSRHQLTEEVTIPTLPAYPIEYVQLGLKPGQRFKLGDLLKATLIHSANDAADALAIYDSGSIDAFSDKMNELAQEWGIGDTHFSNASGINDRDNYSTAGDLVKLAKIALASPTIAETVRTKQVMIADLSGQTYRLASTNQLLGSSGVGGIKTGYTPAAGQSFLALVEIKRHQVLVVILNSPDRFAETNKLISWVEQSYTWL